MRSLRFRQERLQMSLTYLFCRRLFFFFLALNIGGGKKRKSLSLRILSPSPFLPFAEAEGKGAGGLWGETKEKNKRQQA